ncbi:MAG: flagellar assembly protein A [bacterium]
MSESLYLFIASPLCSGYNVFVELSVLDEVSFILEKPSFSNLDSQIIIDIAEDKSQCFLTITHPTLSGKIPQFEDVLANLEENGIKDIDTETIRRILKERDFERKHLIAIGKKAKKGTDAKYLYRFGKIEGKESPLDKFEAISGQLIAVKTHPTKGEDGMDACGSIIEGIMGEDIVMIAGKNTAISRDRTRIYATRNGFVSWKKDRVDLEPLISIDGDLTSDIEFDGSLNVSGSIKGVKVKIGGELKVSKNIESSFISAGGTIEVFEGIISSEITSKGDIIGNSASSSTLQAGSSIIIRTGIVDCNSKARSIFITGKKGIIMTKGIPPPSLFTIPIVISKGLSGLSGGVANVEKVIDVEVLGDVSHKKTEIKVEKNGIISASSSVYPKTKITIGLRSQEIIKPIEGVTFIEDKGKILQMPYKQAEAELVMPIYGPTILKDPPSVIIENIIENAKKEASIFLQIEENFLSEFYIFEYQSTIFFQKDIDGPWKKLIFEIERKRKEREEIPGSFKIDNLPEGLYLTIYPPGKKGIPVGPRDLIEILKEYKELNAEAIRDAIVQMDGMPVKIGERQYIPELDGRIILKLEDEGEIKNAKAFLTIGSPKENGKQIPFTEIIKFLEKEKIRAFDKKKIALALKKKFYNKPFLISGAIFPKKGENACYIYKFGEEPYIYPDVIPGQILAIKDVPKIGTDGVNCIGEVIPGIPGNDFKIQAGRNTFLSKDGNTLYSSNFGRVFWTNNRCDVEKVMEIDGDCDKDIEFLGKIIINGSLKRGVKIKASGGVLIKGNVSLRCEITSGGGIEIDSDIKGEDGNEIIISANGDIVANSISFSNISSEGSVIARTGVTDCNVIAKSLVITGRKGIIMTKGTPPPPIFTIPIAMASGVKGLVGGGRIEISEFIDVEQIGSVSHHKTDIIIKSEEGKISVQDAVYPKVSMKIGKAFLLATKPFEGGGCFKQELGKIIKHPYEEIPAHLMSISYPMETKDIPSSIALLKEEIEKAIKFLLFDDILSISLDEKLSLFFPKGIEGPWKEKEKEITLKIKEKEEAPGSFKIDNTQDGVYLTINPPGIRGKPVNMKDVLLSASEFFDIDEQGIKTAIEKKDGKPIKIGERQYIPDLDSSVKIEVIDEGEIKAKKVLLTIGPFKPGGRKIRHKEVLWHLMKNGIIYGIEEKKIFLALKKDFYKPFIAASCLVPTKGEPAFYLYKYEGKFDVIPGQILAIKKEKTRGNNGINCKGEEIPGIFGDELPIIEGRNTRFFENILYSQASGMATWDGNRCDVIKTITINGDLKENLDFSGKVIISGSVKAGVKINALANIEIGGDIENSCNISSRENVQVSGHILSNSSIDAKYDIIAQSASESSLNAGGAIVVNTGMRCRANADRIYIVGKKGVMMSKRGAEKEEFTLPVAIQRGVKGLIGGEIETNEIFADIIGSVEQEETIIRLKDKGRICCGSIYPKTKINGIEIKKQSDNIGFQNDGGRIKEVSYKPCEIVLTEAQVEPQREKHPESIALLNEERERASGFLKLGDDRIGSLELDNETSLFFDRGIKGPWVEIEEKIEKQKEKPASFEIKSLPEGLYITVNKGGIKANPLSFEEVERALREFYNVDIAAVAEAIKYSSGKSVKIGERQYIRDIDSRIEVVVD